MMFHFDKRGTGGLGFLNRVIKEKRITLSYERVGRGFRVTGHGHLEIADDTEAIAELLTSGARERGVNVPFALTKRVKRELVTTYHIYAQCSPEEWFEEIGVTLFPWGYNVYDNPSEATGVIGREREIAILGEEDYRMVQGLLERARSERWPNRNNEFIKMLEERLEYTRYLID